MKLTQAWIISALTLILTCTSYATYAAEETVPTTAKATAQRQVIVVHLSQFTNNLHAAYMAVKLAGVLQNKGADVTLFLDLEGVRLADTHQPQELVWGHEKMGGTMADAYAAFIKAGGKVLVCPHCAHAAGMGQDHLRPGAKLAKDAEEVADLFFSAEKVIDY